MRGVQRSWRIATGPGAAQCGTFYATDERGNGAPPAEDKRKSIVARSGSPAVYDEAYASRAIGQLVGMINAEGTSAEVAEAGIGILWRVRRPSAVPALLALLNGDESDDVRIGSINALKGIGDDDAVEHLVIALRDPASSPKVRGVAAAALGAFDAFTVLGSVVRDEGLPSAVRAEALYGLQDIKDQPAAKKLLNQVASWKPHTVEGDMGALRNILLDEEDEDGVREYDLSVVAREVLGEDNFLMEAAFADLRQHTRRDDCPADKMFLGAGLLRKFYRHELSSDAHTEVVRHLMECGVCRRRNLEFMLEMKHEAQRVLIGPEMYAAVEPLLQPE
jgi:hypothetical protein